jgi:hypothetical protein
MPSSSDTHYFTGWMLSLMFGLAVLSQVRYVNYRIEFETFVSSPPVLRGPDGAALQPVYSEADLTDFHQRLRQLTVAAYREARPAKSLRLGRAPAIHLQASITEHQLGVLTFAVSARYPDEATPRVWEAVFDHPERFEADLAAFARTVGRGLAGR